MKRFAVYVFVTIVVCTILTLPYSTKVDADPQPPAVSQEFIECTEDIFKNKRPLINDWCVWRIQIFLNEMKWMRGAGNLSVQGWPTLKLDALYGPETAKAVKAYQRSTKSDGIGGHAGPIDGIVGPRTWASLRKNCVDRWGHQHNFYSRSCFVH